MQTAAFNAVKRGMHGVHVVLAESPGHVYEAIRVERGVYVRLRHFDGTDAGAVNERLLRALVRIYPPRAYLCPDCGGSGVHENELCVLCKGRKEVYH